ncbi:STAS domain-containing protein [Streptomyces sp. G1]|uniref:STAS domain-containing protein n=1 Tax=Streptomyces sp. G1 TaxID=361572 RepID=UPI00202E1660|nr:STAS domain-containing protein [Streptomyces sp. G1]MCM1975274.1 STAS domain-containing protein [Streptomyces sp. G1]
MAVRRLDIHRRDKGERALVTLLGEVGPATAPLLRAALEQCLRDGMTVIDVDLTTVGSCDAKGLDVFLTASRRAERVHAALRLHHPCAQITRLLAVTGSAPLLLAAPAHPVPPALLHDLVGTSASVASAGGTHSSGDRAAAPVVKDGIRLRRLTRRQTEGMSEDIADLVVEPVAGSFGQAHRERLDFLWRLAVSARRTGFALLLAETTVLVGCAFGFPVGPGGRSERGLQECIGRLTGGTGFLLLTQVVAQHHDQHRDIGRLLQQRLLADRHAALGVALLHPADLAGQAAYESWGWQNHGELLGLPGRGAPCVLTLFRESGPPVPAPRAAGQGRA